MSSEANAQTDILTEDRVSRCLNQYLLHGVRRWGCRIAGMPTLMLNA